MNDDEDFLYCPDGEKHEMKSIDGWVTEDGIQIVEYECQKCHTHVLVSMSPGSISRWFKDKPAPGNRP